MLYVTKEHQRKNEAVWIEARKRWQINVQKEGIRKTFTSSVKGKKGKAQAEDKASAWLAQDTPAAVSRETLNERWPRFLAYIKEHNSESDYRMIEGHGRVWIQPLLGQRQLSGLTSGDWQEVLDAAYRKGRAKKTIKDIRGSITRFVKYARKNGATISAPEDLVVNKKAPEGKKQPLQPSQIAVLMKEDTDTYRGALRKAFFIHAFRFAVFSGLRRGELLGLRLEDWDRKINVLRVRRSFDQYGNAGTGKSDAAARVVDLCDQAIAELKAQRAMLLRLGLSASPWLFPDETGQRCESHHLYRMWQNYRQTHNITATLHELRHTFISVNKSALPLPILQKEVGHTYSTDTLGIYGHEMEGEREGVSNQVTQAFKNILKAR